jgi:3-hydroxybutyryl-CoA dehydrogenase
MGEIQTIAVIGGSAFGRAIAHAAALAGYRTILENILPASLRQAETEMRSTVGQAITSGQVSAAGADEAVRLLEYATAVEEAARPADLVIEAVPDELDSKLEIVTLLDKICRPHTIFGCTTEIFSITEIASVTYRASNILGMRFANNDGAIARLELVRGRDTIDATVTACLEAGRRMAKEVVVVAEAAATG